MVTLLHRICIHFTLLRIPLSPVSLEHALSGKGSLPQALRVHAYYCWVCQTSKTMQLTTCITFIWAHCLSLWDLKAGGNRMLLSFAMIFQLSCSYPLPKHIWSGSRFTPYHPLWDWSFSLTCTLTKIKGNFYFHHKYPKIQRLLHHLLNIYVLKLKRVALQGNQGNWGRLPWLQFSS